MMHNEIVHYKLCNKFLIYLHVHNSNVHNKFVDNKFMHKNYCAQ